MEYRRRNLDKLITPRSPVPFAERTQHDDRVDLPGVISQQPKGSSPSFRRRAQILYPGSFGEFRDMGCRFRQPLSGRRFERETPFRLRSNPNRQIDEAPSRRAWGIEFPSDGFAGITKYRLETVQTQRLGRRSVMDRKRKTEILDPVRTTGDPRPLRMRVDSRRCRKGVHHARDEPDGCGRQPVEPGFQLFAGHVSCSRRSIRSTNAGFNSMPTHRLPRARAARSVVPAPA